jgi:hypothetical protein
LRKGRSPMRFAIGLLGAAALGWAVLAPGVARAAERVDLELVLAADGSGSIDEDEFRIQRRGYAEAITSPEVLSAILSGYRKAIALAYVEWAVPSSVHVVVDWMVTRDAVSAGAFAARLVAAPRVAWGFNSISAAIAKAAEMIRTNAYEGSRAVIDVSGDGPNMNGPPLEIVRAATVSDGITINGLVVRRPGGGYPGPAGMTLVEHYQRDVIGGLGAFVMVAEERNSFAAAVCKKMVLEIAGRMPPVSADELAALPAAE